MRESSYHFILFLKFLFVLRFTQIMNAAHMSKVPAMYPSGEAK
jgi:hypothetical protein